MESHPASVTALPAPRDRVERAREEIEAAILLVSEAHYPRVTVANLVACGELVDDLRGTAEAAGVDLEPIDRVDGGGCDVAVVAR